MRLIKTVVAIGLILGLCWAKFDPCRFNFGYKDGTANIGEADIVAQYTWSGATISGDVINMLNNCKNSNKTPALYMYVIAKSSGLGDCNTGGGLCTKGADYIRKNKDKIKGYYRDYAAAIKNTFGGTDPVICIMEPDYYQYTASTQEGGGLSFQEAGEFMGELIDVLKAQLPNAFVSMDISPWIEDQGSSTSWFTALPLSKVQCMSTSGGIAQAGSSLIKKENRLTYKRVHELTDKCIIADCGYGVGGGGTGHDAAWDNVANVNDRISEGVMAIIQFSPKQDWGNTIKGISGQLSKPICSCGKTFSLTLNVGSSGKVTKSPNLSVFDSGAVVSLVASPYSGYRFKGWSGDLTGTDLSVNLTMNSNKTVSAAFVDVNAKPSYRFTVNTVGSGLVKISPEQADYDSGTAVTLEVFTVNDAVFSGWSGALSGTGTLVNLVMDGDKSVTATFTGDNVEPPVNLVKNGDFSGGATDWSLGTYNNAKATGAVVDGAYKFSIETPGAESWHIQLVQSGISLKQNENYTLSFIASASAAASVVVNVGMAASPYTSYSGEQTIALTTSPKTYTVNFTMKEASTTDARLEVNSGKAGGSWQIDDISLFMAFKIGVIASRGISGPLIMPTEFSGSDRVTVSYYDFSGRLIHSVSGDYGALSNASLPAHRRCGIAVFRAGSRQVVRRFMDLGGEQRW